jgi:hypothetical protein
MSVISPMFSMVRVGPSGNRILATDSVGGGVGAGCHLDCRVRAIGGFRGRSYGFIDRCDRFAVFTDLLIGDFVDRGHGLASAREKRRCGN